jgi:hypothetical protein
MPEHRAPGETESPVTVGQERTPAVAPDDVLPSIVRSRSDDTQRYIAYSSVADGDEVEHYWLSVDLDAVVSRELWR